MGREPETSAARQRTRPSVAVGTFDPETTVRVATFNVRSGLAYDGLDSWPFRRVAAARAIRMLGVDLVGLQEVHGFQQRSLLRRLHGYAAVGAPRDDGRRRGERSPVFFRATHFQLESQTTRWFSDTPDVAGSAGWGNPLPRIVTLVRLRERRGGRHFGVANAHWDGASATSRLRSAEALVSWLDPELPWIVTGDLNATPDDPAIAALIGGGLRDVLAPLPARGDDVATHHQFRGTTAGTRIDYILVSPEWEILDAAVEHPRPRGRLPSDHWPVVATLALGA